MNNKRKINSNNSKRRFLYLTILFLLLFIGVGYSYLSSSLAINGHTELVANTWNIHFENLRVSDGSSTASVPAESNRMIFLLRNSFNSGYFILKPSVLIPNGNGILESLDSKKVFPLL